VSETLTAVTEKPILLNRLQHLAEPWPASVVGAVESSYFWGYLITQLPGGIIANKLSATRAFGLATVISSGAQPAAPTGHECELRIHHFDPVSAGSGRGEDWDQGCTYPACLGIWRYWAPPHELSQLANIAFCGSNVGVLFSLLLSGALTDSIGWPAPFYIYGEASMLLDRVSMLLDREALAYSGLALWFLYVSEKPAEHPCISEAERNYIVDSIGDHTDVDAQSCDTPWKSIFTSLPVLAVIPTKFFCDVFQFDLTQVRLISLNSFGPCFHGNASIVLQRRLRVGDAAPADLRHRPHRRLHCRLPHNGRLTTTAVRKLYICFGFGMEAIFLLVAGYSSDARVAVVCLTLAVGFSAIALSGFNVNAAGPGAPIRRHPDGPGQWGRLYGWNLPAGGHRLHGGGS
uniref:Inorganic phosphate cotransporter n=1 Tax=Macrostomum lignano TaxID=282301 RepID=A0A1I8FH67_9PLAT